MDQEALLWQLQKINREEHALKSKQELKPMIKNLKRLQDTIGEGEAQYEQIIAEKAKIDLKAAEMERNVNQLTKQMESTKAKLYSLRGGPLKEVLGMQQSVMRMESEIEKGDNQYLELTRQSEELDQKSRHIRKVTNELKKEYNEKVRVYKEKLKEIDLKLAELAAKREEITGNLRPEVIRMFCETERRFPVDPVSMLKDGSCSGCNISVSEMLSRSIKEGKCLNRCDSCGRIIIRKQNTK